ncbi:GGDEF-domain containing protein, partial [Pseudomonas quasicaspiana]|nr:GGDEF-domain containing protein [Pseudomonas quasicaspiana]
AQIVYDAYKTRQAVASDAERILDMFRDPSTQAVYSLGRRVAEHVQDPFCIAGYGLASLVRVVDDLRTTQHNAY